MTRKFLAIGLVCVIHAVGAYADDCVQQLWIGAPDGSLVLPDSSSGKSKSGIQSFEVFSAVETLCSTGTRGSEQDAVKSLLAFADQGLAPAQYALGMAYFLGKGISKNVISAVELFRAASYQGEARAVAAISAIGKFGGNVTPERWAAFQTIALDAAKGKADAQLQLALWLDSSNGDTHRKQEAIRWYRAAANQGVVAAQRGLGQLLLKLDVTEAVQWLEKAGNDGDMQAQNALGMHYRFGLADKPKDELAFKWFRLAAGGGSKNSILRLGDMFKSGDGVSVNLILAYALYFFTSDQPIGLESRLARYEPSVGETMTSLDIERAKNLIREMSKPEGFLAALDRESPR